MSDEGGQFKETVSSGTLRRRLCGFSWCILDLGFEELASSVFLLFLVLLTGFISKW